MKGTSTIVAAGLTLLQTAAARSLVPRQDSCPPLYTIVARGSTEGQGIAGEPFAGQGALNGVTPIIMDAVPGSTSIGLTYPATLGDYTNSEQLGVGNLTQLLEQYTQQCPTTKIALLGFSQGGQVITDTLCGTSEESFPVTSPIPEQYTKNLIAAVTFGDPSHTPAGGFVGNRGNGTNGGGFVRDNIAGCDPYKGRLLAYCQSGDLFCDRGNGSDAIVIHVREVQTYGKEGAAFVISQYEAAVGGSVPTNSSPTSTVAASTVATSASSVVVVPTTMAPATTAAASTAPASTAPANYSATTSTTSKPTNASGPSSTITASSPPLTAAAAVHAVGIQLAVGAFALAGFALL